MNPRNKEQLDRMSPEKRAKAEAAIARHNTPEAKARHYAAIEAVEREVRETGGITTADGVLHKVKVPEAVADDNTFLLVAVGRALRERRQAAGLTLEAVARESGVDQGFLSRLERGVHPNPTVGTLSRVASTVGGRLTITVEAAAADARGPA
jgi:hypothetical protein